MVFYAYLGDVLLQNLGVRSLRVSEVHHLVEQLVADDEVVADALLLHLLEVVAQHLTRENILHCYKNIFKVYINTCVTLCRRLKSMAMLVLLRVVATMYTLLT